MAEQKTIRLTKNDILHKEFKSGFHGYQQDEVDQFLDIIISDYDVFNAEIKRLREENKRLKNQVTEGEEQRASKPLENQGLTNYDILKRLSNLEKHVFGNRLGE
ncbi:cell division regulator GpsB [Sporolactobacillus inulinus]|jgi:DivIVA domain-containing protein|uniref:Cell division protein GpsB n=2 Tax=Sporolactobacillus inulinus TaxID=2078 RepID=A0A4Y1Z9W2_9BACL|nr:cell division regulator GpsB [Sporolactobacillus inulinus]KLI02702.1 cell division protein DivIVA [Sporolactobacillus inulinus CASD]GAY75806.1 cell division protein GpsB [Sporolactobacillus inulinus]GEB76053.1 cell cycle protein GpsB [Sporolactobacillus inulinus]